MRVLFCFGSEKLSEVTEGCRCVFKVGVIMQDKGDTAKAKAVTSRLSVNTLVLMALNRRKNVERDVMHNTRPEVALFLVVSSNHKQLSDLHRNFCCAQV